MTKTIVCVGAVTLKYDRVLLVRQRAGHPLEGQWTVPWGQVEAGESPSLAALREVKEEAGVTARVEGLLGIQEMPDPWSGMVAILFLCSHVEGSPVPDHRETDAADYFSTGELAHLDDPLEPLSDWLVRRVLAGDFTLLPANASGPFAPSAGYL